jgi:hypothetical protein
MWGSQWDERLLNRLGRKWASIRDLEQEQLIQIGEGPQLRLTPLRSGEQTEDAAEIESNFESLTNDQLADLKFEKINELLNRPVFKTTAANRLRHLFSVPKDSLVPNRKPYVCLIHGKSGLEICKPPHILVSAARTFAIYSEKYIIVEARQLGIVSPTEDKEFLKALSLFLSSDFAFYHQFFRSTELGVKRDRATLAALRKMPIPLASLSRGQTSQWVDLHTKLAKCKPRKLERTTRKRNPVQADMFERHEGDLDELLRLLNDMTADALGLSPLERTLIRDFVHVRYALNDGKRGAAAMGKPEVSELRSYAGALKDELDDFVGPDGGRAHRITVLADDRSAMIEIDFTTDITGAAAPLIVSADDVGGRALARARELLLDNSDAWQWNYFNRNLRIYGGRKTYVLKPLNRFHWTQSTALTDASQIIAETLSGSHA